MPLQDPPPSGSFRLPPVAMGGVGGSGTRVLGQILAETGCYTGDAVNPAQDSLWFTALLCRMDWFDRFPPDAAIEAAIDLFLRAMTTGLDDAPEADDEAQLQAISRDAAGREHPLLRHRLEGTLSSLRLSRGANPSRHPRWGWKEPNTQVFLPWLARAIPDLRYVQVVRSGLDMAFSQNQNQVRNWGRSRFGLDLGTRQDRIAPALVLDYWIVSNRDAVTQGRTHLKDRFFLLNYDELCDTPKPVLERLFDFLAITADASGFADRIAPRSRNRHEGEDLSIFSRAQLQAVAEIEAESRHGS